MKPLFKKSQGAPPAAPLVGHYNFKDHYPDVNRNMAWSELEPYLRQSFRRYILPFVGQELYDDLADKIEANNTLSESQEEFITRLRDAAAYCTIMTMLPKKKTAIASMGAVENAGADGTTATSQWAFRTTLWSIAQDADRLVDDALQYLEDRVRAEDPDFDIWKDSYAFNNGKSDLFRTTEEFQQFQNINNSRRTYLVMLPILKQVSRQHIVPVLSQEQYDDLVQNYRDNTLSPELEKLLEKTRAAAAAWAVYYATRKMPVVIDHDGFRVVSNTEAIDQRAYAAEVTQSAIMALQQAVEQEARTNTADLVNFLYENKDDYTLWKDSASNPDNIDTTTRPTPCDYGAIWL